MSESDRNVLTTFKQIEDLEEYNTNQQIKPTNSNIFSHIWSANSKPIPSDKKIIKTKIFFQNTNGNLKQFLQKQICSPHNFECNAY